MTTEQEVRNRMPERGKERTPEEVCELFALTRELIRIMQPGDEEGFPYRKKFV